jgi:hypothetical protein
MKGRFNMKSNLSPIVLLAILVIAAAGCGNHSAQTQSTPGEAAQSATPPTGEGHAVVADVVPGCYEDWCDEHQVPESQCTRCDPSLIPAFQAANDWDPEHGLPMSQCTIHHPDLKIVRPPKPEGK